MNTRIAARTEHVAQPTDPIVADQLIDNRWNNK
jgi:hypothetical protein